VCATTDSSTRSYRIEDMRVVMDLSRRSRRPKSSVDYSTAFIQRPRGLAERNASAGGSPDSQENVARKTSDGVLKEKVHRAAVSEREDSGPAVKERGAKASNGSRPKPQRNNKKASTNRTFANENSDSGHLYPASGAVVALDAATISMPASCSKKRSERTNPSRQSSPSAKRTIQHNECFRLLESQFCIPCIVYYNICYNICHVICSVIPSSATAERLQTDIKRKVMFR
jgi:hypothetical protein